MPSPQPARINYMVQSPTDTAMMRGTKAARGAARTLTTQENIPIDLS
jgi:hypothetical protein